MEVTPATGQYLPRVTPTSGSTWGGKLYNPRAATTEHEEEVLLDIPPRLVTYRIFWKNSVLKVELTIADTTVTVAGEDLIQLQDEIEVLSYDLGYYIRTESQTGEDDGE